MINETVPLDAAIYASAIIKDGKLIKIEISAEEFSVSEDLEHVEPKPSNEAVDIVKQALKSGINVPVEMETFEADESKTIDTAVNKLLA